MTDAEREITETLTQKLSMLTLRQLARAWFGGESESRAAERSLDGLCRRGWLRRVPVTAHPELELEQPLGVWAPGEAAPRFGHLAHRNRKRWCREPERTVVYFGTEQAAEVYGGQPGRAKALHLSHDISLSGVYVRLLASRPAEAALWVSEKTLAPEREDDVLPDAVLREPHGALRRVIEFVGSSYTAERLEELYLDCETRSVPIEFW